jgi:predicted ATPase
MVSKIRFKNFKLFKNWQELEIKPITVLIGKNNTGKSAILKLPTMISESLKGEIDEPISLNSKISVGKRYEELFYNKEILADTIDFEISDEKEKLKISINGINRGDNIEIKNYNLNDEDIKITKSNVKGFKHSKLKSLKLTFDYIDAFREFPKGGYITDINGKIDNIGISGLNAFKLLAQYRKENNLLLSSISRWFEANFEGWKIEIKEIAASLEGFDFVLSNDKIKNINIINTGSGIRQVLPLIVRSYMPVEEETLIIIEEPESHLHPAAHGNLAQRFVDSFLENKNKRYLIETHSKNFILRLQALIADPKVGFSNKDIAVYYVDYKEDEQLSILERLEIDEDGEFTKWPDEIFNESYRELLLLKQNQFDRDDSIN